MNFAHHSDIKMIKNIINKIGSPKIFVYTNIWLIILVFIGTIAQKDLGLYLVQKEYFYPWITWLGILPTPSVKLAMVVLTINLSCYFIKPGIWRLKKIGITITHCGVMLILIGSGLTYYFSDEGNMIIDEGGRSNYYENFYNKELAIINTSDKNYDLYTVFDEKDFYSNNVLSDSSLPFDITVIDYLVNCKPANRLFDADENFKGMAKNVYLQEIPSEKNYEHNRPGIIYEINNSLIDEINGIYMLFLGQSIPSSIIVDKVEFEFRLRPKRTFLPFEIELIDFKKVMHPGTEVAKSFSSTINLIDNNVTRKVLIKMNEPLRHYDYTFYQASFIEEGDKETTVLATVKNYGRMFPYISSIIMCIGILVHLLVMALRNRRRKNV